MSTSDLASPWTLGYLMIQRRVGGGEVGRAWNGQRANGLCFDATAEVKQAFPRLLLYEQEY